MKHNPSLAAMKSSLPVYQALLTAVIAAFLIGTTHPAHAVVIVNDTFDVGASPTVGDDPGDSNDVAWTGNAAVSLGSAAPAPGTGNYLSLAQANNGQVKGQLPVNSQLTLGIGDKVTLTFSFLWQGSGNVNDKDNGFVFGLFSSSDTGYLAGADTDLGTDDGTGTFKQLNLGQDRTANGFAGTFQTFESGDTTTNASANMTGGLDVGPTYSGSLSITRTSATQMTLQASMNGATVSAIDFNGANANDYVFDYSGGFIGLGNSNSNSKALRFDNIKVEVVPEPSTFAMLLGGIGMLMLRRRRG